MLDELADPLGVLDVGLAARDVAQVVRVEQPAFEALLERLEHGLPVHAGRFHPDERHAELGQPGAEVSEPAERRAERSCLLVPSATSGARDADGRDDVVAVHVETRAPFHHHIHRCAPFRDGGLYDARREPPSMSLAYALEAAINGPTGPRATLSHGL
jgi:hypothetical protein